MPLVNSPIANLFNGVSQQPPALRLPSQAEVQENAQSSLAEGLKKRPPTQHIKKLRSGLGTDAFVHYINRDSAERYVVIVEDQALSVYDLATGTLQTLNTPDGLTYLDCTTPREDFAMITVADYSFIVNKTKVTALTTGLGGGTLTGTKQKFADVPGAPAVNDIYEITGDPSNNFDNYFVKWDGAVWREVVKPGLYNTIDPATMPFKLVRNAGGDFTFSKITWDDRTAGDTVSSPVPSFIGRTISDIYFHRNRLGVTADENAVLSRAASFFNYWSETVTTELDTDPIDVNASHVKVSTLNYAVPFAKSLLLFSDQTQFTLTGADTLTTKTVQINPTTEFEASNKCRPATAGQNAYFVMERGNWCGLREYFVDTSALTNDAADITAHVPRYIPTGTFQLIASSNEDTLFALTLGERNAIYLYKYLWRADEKVQASWSKWLLATTDTILGMTSIGTMLYLVVQRADGIHLEKLNLQSGLVDADVGFQIHLDRRASLTGVYNSGTNLTTWTLPYADSGSFEVVLSGSFPTQKGNNLTIGRPTSSTITAVGDYSAGPAYVGRNYTKRYRFSEQFLRDAKSNAILDGRLQLRRFTMLYVNSGYFRVEITPRARDMNTYQFTGKIIGDASFVIGTPAITTGKFTVPVMVQSSGVTIDIVNDSYLPSTFQGAEWLGEFVPKSQRV
jgi:hypothetical protein